MKVTYVGETVDLSNGPLTVRDDGSTRGTEFELVGSEVPMSRNPVNDFSPQAGKSEFQMLGEDVPLNRNPVAGYEGATLSTRASKQQGSGR